MQVRREAEVRQSRAELAADEAFGVFQAVNRRLPAVVFGHDADLDGGIPQVRGELDLGDRSHPDPRVLQVPDDDLADLLALLCGNAFNSVSAHLIIVLRHLSLPRWR